MKDTGKNIQKGKPQFRIWVVRTVHTSEGSSDEMKKKKYHFNWGYC